MATIFLFLLLLSASCFALCKYHKTSTTLLLITLVSFLAIGNGYIPAPILKNLQAPYSMLITKTHWLKRNAIVLLGGGTVKLPHIKTVDPIVLVYSRIYQAASLYKACKNSGDTCTLVISGGGSAIKGGTSEASVYRNVIRKLGVNDADIVLETHSMNTYQNAKFTSSFLKQGQFDQIFLVTSGIHIKRALLDFSHFNIHVIPMPSDYFAVSISIIPLAYNFVVTDLALHEYAGIAEFYFYNFMGWNT